MEEILGGEKNTRVIVDTCKSAFSNAMELLNKKYKVKKYTYVDLTKSILTIDGASFEIPKDLTSGDKVTDKFTGIIGKYRFSMDDTGKMFLSIFDNEDFRVAKEISKGASVQTLINLIKSKYPKVSFPQSALRSKTTKQYKQKEIGQNLKENDDVCALLSIKGAGDEFARLLAEIFTRSRYLKKQITVPGLTISDPDSLSLLTSGDNLLVKNALHNGTICVLLKQRRKLVIGILPCLSSNPIQRLITRFLELEEATKTNTLKDIYAKLKVAAAKLLTCSYSGQLLSERLSILINNNDVNFNKVKSFVTTLRGYLSSDPPNYTDFLKEIKNIGNYILEPSNYLTELLFGSDAGEIVFEEVFDEESNTEQIKLIPQKLIDRKPKVNLYKEFFYLEGKGYVVGVQKGPPVKFLFDKGIMDSTTPVTSSSMLSWEDATEDQITEYEKWKENVKPEKKIKEGTKDARALDMTGLACGLTFSESSSVHYDKYVDYEVLKKAIESTTLPLFFRRSINYAW